FGKPSVFNGGFNMVHPTIDEPDTDGGKKYLHIMPLYSVTERMRSRGLDSRTLMKLTNNLLTDARLEIPENLPPQLIHENGLMSRKDALMQIHFPESAELLLQAEKRLKF